MAKGEETKTPEAAAGQREAKEAQKESRPQEPRGRQPEQGARPGESRPQEGGMVRHRHAAPARPAGGWEPLARLREDFDRLFDQFSRGFFGMSTMPMGRGGWGLDVSEDNSSVTVRAEAPGFEPGDFDIQVRGDMLIMCACRGAEEEEEGYRGWRRREFYESVALPADVDADKVSATYRHGVLTVTLPKSEQGKSRRITVQG